MDPLYFLQFACFIFMLINALILGITRLHMKWANRRYEWSRWLILAGMTGLAIQYLLQMGLSRDRRYARRKDRRVQACRYDS